MLVVSNLSAANAVGSVSAVSCVSVCGVNKKKNNNKKKKKPLRLSLGTATLTD